jgi:hypothetical protein
MRYVEEFAAPEAAPPAPKAAAKGAAA